MLLTAIQSNTATPAGPGAAPLSSARPAPAPVAAVREAAPARADRADDTQDLDKAVADLNDFAGSAAQAVRFSIDEDSGRTLVTVVDSQTQEVLRQIPTKEALSIARSLDKMQGLLIRDKA